MSISLNLHSWFQERELQYCPVHFVKTNTKITVESHTWIKEKLVGRYCLIPFIEPGTYAVNNYKIAFEDSKEAVLYELMWS